MSTELAALASAAQKNADGLEILTKTVTGLVEKMSKTPDYVAAGGNPNYVLPQFRIREGEDSMSSRGFSFMKMLGLLSGEVQRDQAKIELDVHDRLTKSYAMGSPNAYNWAGGGHVGLNKFLAPLATGFMQDTVVDRPFRLEMKSMVAAGTDRADWDEMRYIRTKQFQAMGYDTKALSWVDELRGGSIVAPPEQGELIQLLRNKEALVNAGARVVPLPPQGRLKYPRQTAPSNTYWVGENAGITESNLGTGDVTLQARKLAVLIKAPNELIRFASPAAEALMRDDMTKSLALGLDLAGLEGAGGDTRPRGVINLQGINLITSSDQTADGDKVSGQDIYRMIAAIEESNAEFEAFIMRPKTLYKYYQLRADAVSQGDRQGPFLFNLIREAGAGTPATLAGYPVVKSTQVSQVRAKGQSSNLTYVVGGMWSDLLIGMFGAIEFASTTQGDTSFANDQTWVRGILSADIAARHEAAFVYLDNLSTTL
jgi:HK97 family phage major capsid protein